MLNRLLRHIGEHRIGAAERDDGHLAEEHGDLAEDIGGAQAPRRIATTGTSHSASQIAEDRSARCNCGMRMLGQFLAQKAIGRGAFGGRRSVSCRRILEPRPSPSPTKPISAGAQNDDRKRNAKKKNGDESRRRKSRS